MATIVSTLFISLDGVAEIGETWHFPYFDDEMGRAVSDDYEGVETLLLGRVTYDSFVGAWPDREAAGGDDAEFAASLGDRRKIVVSRQPLEFTWRNSELVDGELTDAVAALRADESLGRVLIAGSISVVRQLLAAGLLDELRLFVHPVAARTGKRLFDEGDEHQHLRLVSTQALPTGVVKLQYAPSAAPGSVGYDDVAAMGPEVRA